MSIIKMILKGMLIFFRGFFFLLYDLIIWGIKKYKNFEFRKVVIPAVIINLIILIAILNKNSSLINGIKLFATAILLFLSFAAIYRIQSKKKTLNREQYINYMLEWSILWICISFETFLYMITVSKYFAIFIQYLSYVGIFLVMHYWLRRFVYRRIKHWISYSIYFFLLPFVTGFIWMLFGDTLSRSLNMPVFVSDNVIGYMTIVLTVVLLNFEIYITPKDIKREVRVAVYLILALYSTISYCFFISDYLSGPIYNVLEPLKSEFIEYYGEFSKQQVKSGVESIMKWITLPYLVGTVIGCFTLELVDRNDELKDKNKRTEVNNNQVKV